MMLKIVVTVLVAVIGVTTTAYEADNDVMDRVTLAAAWGNHMKEHGLQFNSVAEETHAQSNFQAADKRIKAHNSDPTQTYKQGHNKFSHMNKTQKNAHKGAKVPSHLSAGLQRFTDPQLKLRATLPASVDLRTNKCMQPVKDQGQCGDCYAFSAVTVLEFDYCIKHGSPVSLSEQQVTDCSSSFGNYGCDGGWQANVWQYVAANGGLDTQASYPFTSGDSGLTGSTCNYKAANVGGKVSTTAPYTYLTPNSVTAIKTSLANNGPVAVAINANDNFLAYTSGIFSASATSWDPSAIDHAVTVVGYGTSGTTPYWIVRNSWSAQWGAAGYILMKAGANTCGIESYPMTTTAA